MSQVRTNAHWSDICCCVYVITAMVMAKVESMQSLRTSRSLFVQLQMYNSGSITGQWWSLVTDEHIAIIYSELRIRKGNSGLLFITSETGSSDHYHNNHWPCMLSQLLLDKESFQEPLVKTQRNSIREHSDW